jgi:hypothetical protein
MSFVCSCPFREVGSCDDKTLAQSAVAVRFEVRELDMRIALTIGSLQ